MKAALRHLMNIILWFLPPSRFFWFRRLCLQIAGVEVSGSAKCCGRMWVYGPGRLQIGERTWISPGAIFYTNLAAEIVIGDQCDIGPGVEFVTGSHEIGPGSRRAGPGSAHSITVGRGSWIGAGSIVLGGVIVGEGSIVAAGSVVIEDVEANTLVAGVPAAIKRSLPT